MALEKKRALFYDVETTYGSDPSTDGSGYTWIPTLSLSQLTDGKAPLETDYFTGRPYRTAGITGPDGWSFDIEVPMIGLATAAGDGVAPPADDWLDALLTHALGTQTAANGEGVLSVPDGTGVVLDTDIYNIQQVFPVFEAALPTNAERSQWNVITVDNGAGDYDLAPGWTTNPTTAGVAYGTNSYEFNLDAGGGSSLAFVYQEDDVYYTLLGGRCTSFRITAEAAKVVRIALSFRGDTKTEDTAGKTTLPTPGAGPAITPIKWYRSPVYFGTTAYTTRRIEVNLNLGAEEQVSNEALDGRADDELLGVDPTVTIEPLRTDAIMNLRRDQTKGRLLAQFGQGSLSGGVLNTCALHMEEAVASEASVTADGRRLRNGITFRMSDPGVFSGSTLSKVLQFVRA